MKQLFLAVALLLLSSAAHAKGTLHATPSKELWKDAPVAMTVVDLEVQEELWGPFHAHAITAVDYLHSEPKGFQQMSQDLGIGMAIGKYIDVEPGLSFSKPMYDNAPPEMNKKIYLKVSAQLW